MSPRTTKLCDAIAVALVISVATIGNATAQDAAADSEAARTLDTITVTGSRIAIPGVESFSPITSVLKQDIDRTQPIAVEDFLKKLPGVEAQIGPGINNGSNGGATISLRNLGANRSLVLIDGRRVVPFTLSGTVDTNVIPVSLIESVDVLTGGASAVYGADAVAGVVNFKLRRDFEGAEFSTSYGQSSRGDQARQKYDLTLGANLADGKGNVVLNIGYTKADPLLQDQRPYGVFSINSVTGGFGGSATSSPVVLNGAANLGMPNRGGLAQMNPATGRFDAYYAPYNYNPLNYYYTPMDRYQTTALGHFRISDRAEVYANLMYTRSKVDSLAAESGSFLNTFAVPIGNPYLPQAARQQICDGLAARAVDPVIISNCSAGSTELVNLTLGRRFTELGPRFNSFDNKTFNFTVGLRGDLNDRWSYDAYYSRGESDQYQVRRNWGSMSKLRQALNAVSTTACINPAGGCVPLNIFGADGSITKEMIDFINLSAYLSTSVRQEVLSGSFSGDLGDFKSPWSDYPIGMAIGVENRRSSAVTRSDSASQIQGEVLGTGAPTPDRQGSFKLQELYGETVVPLLSGMRAAHALNLEAGFRYSEFSTSVGAKTDYNTWKYGLDWAPIEQLRFRGTVQRATRAPNIGELFNPQVTGLNSLANDPCAGAQINQAQANTAGTLSNLCRLTGVPLGSIGSLSQPSANQISVLTGGNPNLTPEVGNTRTLGLVWSPTFARDLSFTLDYWKIEMTNMIGTATVGDVINGCYSTALNPGLAMNGFCQIMGRNPLNGTFNGIEARGLGLLLSNLGKMKTDGFDVGARYSTALPRDLGRMNVAFNLTRTNAFDYQATPSSINRDCLGYYSVNCPPLAGFGTFKNKAVTTVGWVYGDLDLSLSWRYLGGMQVEPGTTVLPRFASIGAYNYFDLSVGYQAPFNAKFTLSVNNLTGKNPPIVGDTFGTTTNGNTFPQSYDVLGRYYMLGARFTF